MTRIIGGAARGRTLRTPPGDGTRPTADRVREALFSSLESTFGTLDGVTVLDVYAGSGAVALEAASRGASRVTAVERNRTVSAVIQANARSLGLAQVDVLTGSASALGDRGGRGAFDVAFLDPPYDVPDATVADVMSRLATGGWLSAEAVVAVERSRRSGPWSWPAGFVGERDRRYGDTVLWYGRWQSPPGPVADPARPDEES